ncbi:hypothetical protein BC829DRAFT_176148 [Chytridium lagenaria]|nr:hypothetical protein BC829DRAFT_176148 [Chytridium lagenaria]
MGVTGTASSTFLPLPNSSKPRRRDCRPQTLVLHFFRILAVAVVLFTGYAILLTLYMLLIREGGPTGFRAPTIHHLTIPNPFSSMSCYTHQLRFLMGTVVGNRIIHKAKCSDEVLEAVIANERTWPPKPRGGIYADRFLREQGGRICDPGDGAELEFADGTLKFPNSSTKCIPNVEWVIYATNCNNGINRLARI